MRACSLLAFCAFAFSPVWLPAQSPLPEEEGLSLRRIADFWQEGEYQIAKSQMEEFLSRFPDSPYAETLCVALADLYMREKNYTTALEYYARVHADELAERVFLNRMQCLYHMQWYATLADECEAYLQKEESTDPKMRLQATYLLAISLYQQCLNVAKEPESLNALALRAKPHFEELFKTELSEEIAQAFAHLCCILNDYEGAAAIYLDLAKQATDGEKLLFQAALLQSKYNKDLALETFQSISAKGGQHAKEAAYNRLILTFDQGRFAEIAERKENILQEIPTERTGLARLIIGKSLLALKQHKEAALELNAFLQAAAPTDSTRPALLHLMEAAYQSSDLELLDQAIARLRAIDENDLELAKALFSRAQLLKKEQNALVAQAQLESLLAAFPKFPERPQATFELAHLASSAKNWPLCRSGSLSFVQEFPEHELAPFAWRYLAAASAECAAAEQLPEKAKREQLTRDLQLLITQAKCIPLAEQSDWAFLLAKTHYEIHQFAEAIQILEPLVVQTFNQKGNAELLLGLCYRDGLKNEAKFEEWAIQSLRDGQSLLPAAQLHISLFNSYLSRSEIDAAAKHLQAAFEAKADIQLPNLVWLADYAYGRFEHDPAYAEPAAELLAQFIERTGLKPSVMQADTLYLEPLFLKLAKLYHHLHQHPQATQLLEELRAQYTAHPTLAWTGEKETKLLLAESHLLQGSVEKAQILFEEVAAASPTKRNRIAASASLQSARIKLTKLLKESAAPNPADIAPIAAQLKDLVIQKTLESEPLHLEAALDYIDLQTLFDGDAQKRLALLTKTKQEFELQDDLLAKDYHAARAKLTDKNKLYLAYIQFFDAELFLAEAQGCADAEKQKELQAKAKDLLLQLESSHLQAPVAGRVQQRLQSLKSLNEPAA